MTSACVFTLRLPIDDRSLRRVPSAAAPMLAGPFDDLDGCDFDDGGSGMYRGGAGGLPTRQGSGAGEASRPAVGRPQVRGGDNQPLCLSRVARAWVRYGH